MKINILCSAIAACTSMMIVSSMFNPDPNAAMRQRWAEQDQQMRQRMEQQRQDMSSNAAAARIYQSQGQLVPPHVMARLDAGNYALACQHNQTVLQQQKK